MKQMELANHSASFPELPGIPTLGLSFPYACVMKLLPFHGNRTGITTQAGPGLCTESITHVCPERKAKASFHSLRHSDLPGGRPLRLLMSLAQGEGVRASPWSWWVFSSLSNGSDTLCRHMSKDSQASSIRTKN